MIEEVSENLYKEEYEDFAYKCFNYLNGKINPINKVKFLKIQYKMPKDLRYGSINCKYTIILIHMKSILQKFHKHESIKTKILLVISHELAHASQIINKDIYNTDPIYKEYIENRADYISRNYLLLNYDKLKTELYNNLDKEKLNWLMSKLLERSSFLDVNLDFEDYMEAKLIGSV